MTEDSDPALFWATAGGMGLTGLIVRATIQLKRVATSRVRVDTVRTADIDQTMSVLAEHDGRFGYTVAWSDSLARGSGLGRSVITSGDFAEPGELSAAEARGPVRVPARRAAGRPARCPSRPDQPLHGGPGRRGLLPPGAPLAQRRDPGHRPVLPPAGRRSGTGTGSTARAGSGSTSTSCRSARKTAVRRSFELVSQARAPSFVTVLKRFGAGGLRAALVPDAGLDPGPGLPGPHARARLSCWVRSTGLVAVRGGRVYLAKDSRVQRRGAGRDVPAAARVPQAARRPGPGRDPRLRPFPPPRPVGADHQRA